MGKEVYPLWDQMLVTACDGINYVIETMHLTIGTTSLYDLGVLITVNVDIFALYIIIFA